VNRRMAIMNQIVAIVRQKNEVNVYELSAHLGLAPSTVYQYAKVIPNVFHDIEYERGVLKRVLPDE